MTFSWNEVSPVLALLMIVTLVVVHFVIPPLLTRRAIPSVVRIFRQHGAVSIEGARTTDELGLRSKVPHVLLGPAIRNYQIVALEVLKSANVVRWTEDRRLYLSEKDLAGAGKGQGSGQGSIHDN
jgi:hypothetical protein